jgi:hypothetical protein
MSHLGPFAVPIGVVAGFVLILALGSYRKNPERQPDAGAPGVRTDKDVLIPARRDDALSSAIRTNPHVAEVRKRVVESVGGEDALRHAVRQAEDSAALNEQAAPEVSLGHKIRMGLDLCFFAVIVVGFMLVLTYEYEVDLIEAAENAFPREASVIKDAYLRMREDFLRR